MGSNGLTCKTTPKYAQAGTYPEEKSGVLNFRGVNFRVVSGFYNRNGFIGELNPEHSPKYAHVLMVLILLISQ